MGRTATVLGIFGPYIATTNYPCLPYGSSQYIKRNGVVYYLGEPFFSPTSAELDEYQFGQVADLRRYICGY